MPARHAFLPLLLLAAAGSAFASGSEAGNATAATPPTDPPAASGNASPATASFGDARDTSEWAALTALAGTWAIASPTTDAQRAFRVQYRLVSNAAALVEIYGSLDGRFTQTIFHPDGERILATHYCAQGNQPRLQLTATAETLDFTYLDATNLRDPDASRLTRLQLRADGGVLTRREVYTAAGVDTVDELRLRRID